ncbi:Crp/Fnr family transcriptional regulator [Profundibacter sp.]
MKPTSPQYQHCLDALNASPFFAALDQQVSQELLAMFTFEKVLKRDTRITGDDDQEFYLFVTGRAKVSVFHPETGREHIMSLLGSGDCFDVVSLLDAKPRNTVLTALDDVEFLTAPLSTVRKWLLEHPDFNKAFLPYMGNQMRQLADQIEDLALYDTEARLARLILRHITSNAPVHGLRLINDLSQETLAAMIGSVRVVVGRQMKVWKQNGLLANDRGQWSVDDLQALIAKAERQFKI